LLADVVMRCSRFFASNLDKLANLDCAETLFFDYRRQTALEINVARIFNTCGPRMQTGSSSKLVNMALPQDDPNSASQIFLWRRRSLNGSQR
jgi:hypothetical protein